MSWGEYTLRMYAYNLQVEDRSMNMHVEAWINNRIVTATNKKGEYIYKKFEDFYEPAKKLTTRKLSEDSELYKITKNLERYREIQEQRGGN